MKTKIYFSWKPDEFMALESGGFWSGYSFSHCDDAIEVEVDLPDITDARERLIDAIRNKKAKIISEATKEAEQLDEKIQQLLALDAPVAA